MPAQDDLGWRLARPFGDGPNDRVAKDAPLPQRRPGLDRDLMLGAEGAHVVLSQVRVHLDLVDGRDDLGLTVQAPEVAGLEVGHADGPGPALAVELLQRDRKSVV